MLKKIVILGLGIKFASTVLKKLIYQIFLRKSISLKENYKPIVL